MTGGGGGGLVKGEADHQGLVTGGKCRSGRGSTGSAGAEKFGDGPEPTEVPCWELPVGSGFANSTARRLPGNKTEAKANGLRGDLPCAT